MKIFSRSDRPGAATGGKARVVVAVDVRSVAASHYNQDRLQRVLRAVGAFSGPGARPPLELVAYADVVHKSALLDPSDVTGSLAEHLACAPGDRASNVGAMLGYVRQLTQGYDGPRHSVAPGEEPTYLVVLTGGSISDAQVATAHLAAASREPMFVQFVLFGQAGRHTLHKGATPVTRGLRALTDTTPRERYAAPILGLHHTKGRQVRNTGLVGLHTHNAGADTQLAPRLVSSYGRWLNSAATHGIVRR